MVLLLKKILVSVVLLFMAVFVIRYGCARHIVDTEAYDFGEKEEHRLRNFADARYDYGVRAWFANDLDEAERFFSDAVSADELHVDAWLRLARVRIAKGDRDAAGRILRFTDVLTKDVVKWKWEQILLAGQLGFEDMLIENINFVIPHSSLRQDALQLLDMHFGLDVEKTVEALEADNLNDYLEWLMRWQRTEDSVYVWEQMLENIVITDEMRVDYINYLVRQKELAYASNLWDEYSNNQNMMNVGFENARSKIVFDWWWRSTPNWDIWRVDSEAVEGFFALEVSFSGENNIRFNHLRQIVPVLPGKTYKLSYKWQSSNLTTDQRPFVDVYGYGPGCEGLYEKGDMIPPDTGWQGESIAFSTPGECRGVVVRLRRDKSHRFDSKIGGRMWLDDFELREVKAE